MFTRSICLGLSLGLVAMSPLRANEGNDALSPEEVERISKAFGHMIGSRLRSPELPLDSEAVVRGIQEGSKGEQAPMDETEYLQWIQRIQGMTRQQVALQNLKEAGEFLKRNASLPGVVSLQDDKLQYRVIRAGNGSRVLLNSEPLLRYSGHYIDGSHFSSSDEAGGDIVIPLDQAIPGFSSGVAGMREGEKREIVIHPDLAYGDSGQLPPNALLIFEVEVLKANTQVASSLKTSVVDSSEPAILQSIEVRELKEPEELVKHGQFEMLRDKVHQLQSLSTDDRRTQVALELGLDPQFSDTSIEIDPDLPLEKLIQSRELTEIEVPGLDRLMCE